MFCDMSYCLNPDCQHPHNLSGTRFCQSCGASLFLKERYRILQLLGQSSTSRTYLAVDGDQPSHPRCVVKQFTLQTPQASERGLQGGVAKIFNYTSGQLEALSKHPMIPKLWASFEQDGYQYLVQEYIEGQNLAQELAETGPFSEAKIRTLLKELLPVLHVAHSHQVLHGDIKPENIIRRRSDGKLVLVDYGHCAVLPWARFISDEFVSGSAEFAAPEQIRGQASSSSDLYSLGVTCVYLLTQVSPFDLFEVKIGTWVWRDYLKTSVSPHFSHVLDQLLQQNPKLRYQSAQEALKDLQSWMMPVASTPIKTRIAIGAFSGALIAMLMAVVSLRQSPPVPYPSFHADEVPLTLPELDLEPPADIPSYRRMPAWKEIQPLRTLTGEAGPLWSVAVSPDGSLLASGSFNGSTQLWQLDTGQQLGEFSGHTGAVWAVAMSPNGKLLATGSEDKTVKLWNLRTGELLHTFKGHSEAVFSIAFSPDGQTLASVSEDKTIKLWNLQTDKLQRTLKGHTDAVQSVAFSADGQTLVTGSSDSTVKVWNAQTGQLEHTLRGHSDDVWSVAVSPDGQLIASGSWDDTVKLWDLHTGWLQNTFIGHADQVQSVAFSPDGQTLASGDMAGTIKLWQIETGGLWGTLKGHTSWVKLAFSPYGKTLISGSYDDTIKLWQLSP
jgi:serine/threonine protein kinase